jgi:hypothetical protein
MPRGNHRELRINVVPEGCEACHPHTFARESSIFGVNFSANLVQNDLNGISFGLELGQVSHERSH